MTRTGVLSLLVAAYAVTSSTSAFAVSSGGSPRHLSSSRSMQAFLSSSQDAPDLDTLDEYHDKVFSQFIDSSYPRVEGHILTDKIIYRQNDTVFIDLLVVKAMDLTPHINSGSSYVVSLLDNTGVAVSGLAVTLNTAGPAYGLTFKIPSDLAAGNYLILAEGTNMAAATRTIVVQAMPSTTTEATPTDPWLFNWLVFEPEVQQFQPWGLAGKVQVLNNTGSPAPLTNTFVHFAYSLDGGAAFQQSDAITDKNGYAYFFFDYPTNGGGVPLTTATSEFTVTVTSSVSGTLTDQKTITIGDTFDLVQLTDTFRYSPETDFLNVHIAFFTESQSDLINEVANKIYFRAFRANEDGTPAAPFEFTGATLYTYDPLLPAVPVEVLQTNVSTSFGGYGVLDEVIVNKNQTMFLELQFEDWTPIYGSYETVEEYFYPTQERVILEDGTIRFPIVIEGLQTQYSNIYYNLFLSMPESFPLFDMFDYQYEFIVDDLFGAPTPASNTYTFGYANNFFYVKLNSVEQPDVRLPPVLVFNSFPVPGNFSNLLLGQKNYITGIAQDSIHVGDSQLYHENTDAYFDFSAQDISYTFYKYIAQDLEDRIGSYFGWIECMTATQFVDAGTTDAERLDSILALRSLFAMLPFAGQYDSEYFGKYGPIDEQVPHLYTPLSTSVLADFPMVIPHIAMSIEDKQLGNSEDLVVEISTNLKFDTEEIYMIQIQHKEEIIYEQILNLEKRMAKEKFTISAANFPLQNGGILQVNLQRIKPDFQDFLDVLGERTSCDLTTIASAFKSMTTENQQLINATADYEIMDLPMDTVIDDITINIPGAECVLIGPDLTSRFYELSGTILVFKEPAKIAQTVISTSSCANALCSPSTSVTFTASNYLLNRTTVSTSVSGAYKATILVTQETPDSANNFYDLFMTDQIFLENLIDYVGLRELEPLYATVPLLSNLSSTQNQFQNNIDFVLVASALRHLVFQSKVYQVLGNDIDFADFFTRALPKTGEQLSQMFGYNFLRFDHNTDPIFSETDIRNYIDDGSVEENIVPLDGSQYTWNGTIVNPELMINSTAAMASPFHWGARRPATYSSATYNRFSSLYHADTLYFASNVATGANGALTINFDTSDTPGDYYVYVYEYSDNGYTFGYYPFTVLPVIDFDFEIPQYMSVNDDVNITMKIVNGMKQAIYQITPSLTAGLAHIAADFSYTRWLKVKNIWTPYTGNTTYTLTAADVTKLVPFKIRATSANSETTVTISFSIKLLSTSAPIIVTKTKTVNILSPQTRKDTFGAAILASSEYETYPYAQDVTFDLDLPPTQAEYFSMAKIALFPTGSAYGQYNTYREVLFAGEAPATLIDLLGIAQKVLAVEKSVEFNQVGSPQYVSVAYEGETLVIALVKQLELFQVLDMEGNRRGWDNYRFTDQRSGDPIFTAEIINFLISNYDAVLTWDADLEQNLPDIISQNVDWLVAQLDTSCEISFPADYFFTSDLLSVQAHIAYHLTEALQNDGLNINIINPTQVTAIEAYLDSCFDESATDPLTILSDVVDGIDPTEPLATSPYQLAMVALAAGNYFSYESITTRDDELLIVLEQLSKHVQQLGEVVTPAELKVPELYPGYDLSRDVITVYGEVGLEKETTIAAQAAQAFIRFTPTGSDFGYAVNLIAQYLVTISENGQWGQPKSTGAAVEIVSQYFQSYTDAVYNVRIEIHGVTYKELTIPQNFISPIELYIPASAIPQARFTAGHVNFTVDIYDLVTPHNNGGTNEDIMMGVTFSYLGLKSNQPSWPVYTHDLALSVTSLQANTSLGSAATLGNTFEWSVTSVNQNPNRPTGGVMVTIAPPACIDFDPLQLNDIPEVAYWAEIVGDYRFMVYLRNIPAGEMTTFNYYGTQSRIGVCATRIHNLEFQSGANIVVFAVPDSYYENGI